MYLRIAALILVLVLKFSITPKEVQPEDEEVFAEFNYKLP
jgi:hypothetical protein